MLRAIAATVGVVVVLFGTARTTEIIDPEAAGFRIVSVSCAADAEVSGGLRCVAEVERLSADVGMLTAAWGLDGGYLVTDAVTDSLTSWVLDDPPSGEHVVHLAVVDPDSGLAVETTTAVEVAARVGSWRLPFLGGAAIVGLVVIGLLLWRRRSSAAPQVVCGSCSFVLGDDDRFCPACGSPVVGPEYSFCPDCGTAVDPSGGFCARCGRRLIAGETLASHHPPR